MNIYDALAKDHRLFEQLLDKIIASSKRDDDQWKSQLDHLRRELIAHAHAEESVLYNALREEDTAQKLVAHSYAEHAMAETEIRTLTVAKMIDTTWTGLAEKLSKDLRHHIQEEENEVFAAARKVFSDAEAEQLGAAFERLKAEMRPDGDSMLASTIDLVANLLPPRLSARFRKMEARSKDQDRSSQAPHA
jgi:hemerythrin superfamily protein